MEDTATREPAIGKRLLLTNAIIGSHWHDWKKEAAGNTQRPEGGAELRYRRIRCIGAPVANYEGPMRTLAQDAQSYLEAGGYRLARAKAGFLELEGPARHAPKQRILIWSDDEARPPSTELSDDQRARREAAESALLRLFETEMRRTPNAIGYYLVAGRLGYSQHFVSEATRILGVSGGIRVPVEFFDSAYKIERAEARRARSVLGNVLAVAGNVRRVAQPFSIRESLATGAGTRPGRDLVEHLAKAIADPSPKARLHIIDGAAGSGKTIGFNALAAALYDDFSAAKKARNARARPILFLPDHLRGERIGYVDDILAAVAETDMAEPTTPEQSKWLLRNGHAIWMFDGLDEFYAGGSDFFAFVAETLSAPGSKAQFVICSRDSLLNSAPVVRQFIERQLAAGTAEICELSPWSTDAWRQLAWLELENGREGAMGSPRVQHFVSSLERWSEVAAMARLPFYCRVLLAHFCQNGNPPRDEFDVLELLVDSMIRREHGKRVFQWQDFVDVDALAQALEDELSRLNQSVPSGGELQAAICRLLDEQAPELLFELIGGLAHRVRRLARAGDGTSGFSADDARDLVSIGGGRGGSDNGVLRRLRTTLVRFAFFGPGRKVGALDFTHEILAEYFAARYGLLKIETALDAFAGGHDGEDTAYGDMAALLGTVKLAVGTVEVVPCSLFHRYFARRLEASPGLRAGLALVLERGGIDAANVRDFLELLLNLEADDDKRQPRPPPLMPQHLAMAASRIP
jgi:hypothetical protein